MTDTVVVREIPPKIHKNGNGHSMNLLHDEHLAEQPKPEKIEEPSHSPTEPVAPPKAGRRP